MKRGSAILTPLLIVVIVASTLALACPTPVAASSQYPVGSYWYAEFFDTRWPSANPILTRYDASVDFDWGTGSPNVAVPVDNFSARWTRTADFTGGEYKFWVLHDDGVLLWVDDELIINQWYDQPAFTVDADGILIPNTHQEELYLSPGSHRIKLEYYEHGKNAAIQLGWEWLRPGAAAFAPPPAGTLQTDAIHVVRPGEWLYKIARTYNISIWAIVEANNLSSLQLVPGQLLIIPGTASAPAATACQSSYTVQPGDNMFRISLRFNVSLDAMATQNGLTYPYTVYAGQALCVP